MPHLNAGLMHALSCTAIGAGAKVLEKHLTLGKVMKLEDYESALNPDEFKEFVEVINQSALALGNVDDFSDDFEMSVSEKKYRKAIRRHVVTSKPLKKGHTIGEDDVLLKRTASMNVIYDLNKVYQKIFKGSGNNEPILENNITKMKYNRIKVGMFKEITHLITQDDIKKFVELTGDDNKLHLDKEFASKTPFKKPLAHGMLGASFISTVIGTQLPGDGALWFSQNIDFLSPVREGGFVNHQS